MKWHLGARAGFAIPTAGIAAAIATIIAIAPFAGCRDSPTGPCGPALPARNAARVTIQQGIWGDVWFWEGDFMPVCPSGTVTAVQREVRVYELTTTAMCDSVYGGGFFQGPHSRLLAVGHSDARGFFQIPLDPGRYTLCVVEGDRLYANGLGGANEIYPVEVHAGSVTGIRFDITYRAVY